MSPKRKPFDEVVADIDRAGIIPVVSCGDFRKLERLLPMCIDVGLNVFENAYRTANTPDMVAQLVDIIRHLGKRNSGGLV